MKTISILSCLIFLMLLQTKAQVVDENVNFDFYQSVSNNDFINNFSGGLGLTQIQTGGITGGCLTTPDSISWGNDNAIYCSRYKPVLGDTTVTAISFKYDSTTVNINSFQRALSIFLRPYADFNHYIIASVSGNKKLELITYGWVNTPYPDLNLLHNHWYRYELKVAFIGGVSNDVYINAEVFDLGTSGTSTPVLVNSDNGTINDNILLADTSIQVSFTATYFGGATYIDDFHFHGRKGYSNCIIISGLTDVGSPENITVYPSPAINILHVTGNERSGRMEAVISNLAGENLMQYKTSHKKIDLDVSGLANGAYILRCKTDNEIKNFKVIISR